MDGLPKRALRKLFKNGLHVIPYMSEQQFLAIFEDRIKDSPYPDGRKFMRDMLVIGKRVITSRQTRKMAMRVLDNMIIQEFDAEEKRKAFRQKQGFEPPTVMVISPTMRCNLKCYGCYAGEYNKSDDLDTGLLTRVVREAKEMGIFFITVSGGEPFISQDVLHIWENNRDVLFQVYTNGTLIDNEMAQRLAEYGNVLPCISVEGFEQETDSRRGPGTFNRIMNAMDNLKKAGVLFGFSATATRKNNELISSREFVNYYAGKGCVLGWYFNYMPIGRKPDINLMPTPQQRIDRMKRVREIRKDRKVLVADFWCDGSLVGGCIAGGRSYFHINNRGDVEPCVFAHFASDNIRDKSLEESLTSAFFNAIRRRQPYCSNYMRPCMIIDNPSVLREVVKEGEAHPTHSGAETIITDLADDMDRYANEYGELADQNWKPASEPVPLARIG